MIAPGDSKSQGRADWRERPERSNYLALFLMRWIALRLGRSVARLVLWPITIYFCLFNRQARRASHAYLQRVLGGAPGWTRVTRHVYSFSATILDRIYLLNDRFDLFDIQLEGEDLLRAQLQTGNGVLLFGAHVGSFEAVRALGRRLPGQRIALTMYEQNARRINGVLAAINPRNKPEIIPLGRVDTMLQVHDALNGGAMVGLLADRHLGGDETRSLPLLGGEAAFPVGPFRMAAMMRQPVVFMVGLYLGGNRYRVRFSPLIDFANVAAGQRAEAIDTGMRRYVQQLEQCCREAPFNWFNFFDFWQADDDSLESL